MKLLELSHNQIVFMFSTMFCLHLGFHIKQFDILKKSSKGCKVGLFSPLYWFVQ